uniref:Indole acetamide hydrolase n=1 Tax=Variovorax paradoxus TaxID=34073 RepID=Q9RHQ6_VARPD|nr:indole acetamide hydrolase [Variovorax paradoxus]
MDLCEHGVASLRNALLSGATSCVEHATALIARTQALAHLNGYVDFDPVPFLAQARQADVDIARGVSAPLLGVPLALKDNINTTGFPTGVGTRTLRGRIPAADAEIVKRLKQSGAIISGKAGMHRSWPSASPATTGSLVPSATPGHSSAVVVAAGLVPGAIGTDTGASVRLPAALCGIAGLRPTVGRVPGTGIAPISSTRDTAGPMARSIADLALLDTALTGDAAGLAKVDLRGLRLGIPNDRFWTPLDASVAAVMDDTRKELQRAGVDFVELDLPGLDALNNSVGFPVGLFEFMAEMPDYLKASGHPLDIEALLAGIGSPDVAGILRPLLGSGAIPEPVYRAALADRQRLQELYRRTFAQHQVRALAFPTSALTARPLGTDDTVEFLGQRCPAFMIYIRNTDPGSNAGIPGLSLPAGIGPDGLPVGLELDGPAGSDRDLLAIGAALETVLPPIGRPSLRSPEGA